MWESLQKLRVDYSGLNEKFFFLRFAGLIVAPTIRAAPPRTQKIEPHLDSLQQRRSFLDRPPETVLELRARLFNGLQDTRQDVVGVQQLTAQPVRSFRKNPVYLLRLSSRQVHHVRGVIHHAGDFWLSVVQKNLHAGKNRTHARLH